MATISPPQKSPATVDKFPSPSDRPQADVVIFDGHCRFCLAQIRRLNGFDWGGRLAYLSLHDPEVARRWPELKHDDLMREMLVIDMQGSKHRGADAGRYLSRRLPTLWWMAPLLHIPGSMPLWRWMYRQVANRRYLFGRIETCTDDACSLHR